MTKKDVMGELVDLQNKKDGFRFKDKAYADKFQRRLEKIVGVGTAHSILRAAHVGGYGWCGHCKQMGPCV